MKILLSCLENTSEGVHFREIHKRTSAALIKLSFLSEQLLSVFLLFHCCNFFTSFFLRQRQTRFFSKHIFIYWLFIVFNNENQLTYTIPKIILLVSFHLLVKPKSISTKISIIFIFESRAKWSTSG